MRAAIYVRQSKDRDGTEAAVSRQLTECNALAERLGIEVAEEYVDNDVSASKGTRPAFQRLLQAVAKGEVDTVIVWATDRLYRRLRDLVHLVELAEQHKLRILTVKSGDLDLGTPAGRMLAGMLGSAARFEVEQKGARQVAANAQRARKGIWQFSRRPYGYRRVDGEVVQVPEEAAVLREAYRRSLAGESAYSVVADLNARGIPAQGGGEWSISDLRLRMSNPHYAGLIVHQGEVVGEGTHEPIVSREEFEAYVGQAKIRAARKTSDNRVRYLLSGLARCGVCGGVLFARPEYRRAAGKHMTYACTTSWCVSRRMELVDEVVEAIVVARLSRPDVRELLSPDVDVQPLVAEAVQIRDRLDDLAALLAEGALTASAVREQSAKLRERLEEVNAQIGRAQGESVLATLVGADDVAARWSEAPLAVRRDLLRALGAVTIERQSNPRVFDPRAIRFDWRGAA